MAKPLTLPRALLEEIERSSGKKKRPQKKISRKDARKQERDDKKQRKAVHFQTASKPSAHVSPVKRPAEEEVAAPRPAKKAKLEPKQAPKPLPPTPASKKKKTVDLDINPNLLLNTHEYPEDAEIARLERLLGKSKGKAKKQDNFEGLLGDLDDMLASGSEGEGDGEDVGLEDEMEDEYENLEDEGESEEGEEEISEEEEAPKVYDEEEWGGIDEDALDSDEESEAPELLDRSTPPPPPKTTSYIPPHLRKQEQPASEAQQKLTRQLKGLVNRLSDQNIGSILSSIEDIYRGGVHSRHDISSTMTTLLLSFLASRTLLSDTYIILHAAFIGGLARIIGADFVPGFVYELTRTYDTFYGEITQSKDDAASKAGDEEDSPSRKEPTNLLTLLSSLYTFKLVSPVLIYDIIRELLSNLGETDVELLLRIIQVSGQQLRHDDPLALKDIVEMMNESIAARGDSLPLSSRTKFMVETLTNLKNNSAKASKFQKSANAAGVVNEEATEKLKKFLAGMEKKTGKAQEPLRISLADLRAADTKGRWWVVGAAWTGDPLLEKKEEMSNTPIGSANSKGAPLQAPRAEESKLLELAKKQGMNTDIRRSVFVVMMSSEDYVDACDRLGHLRLTEVQQREIIRVLWHCIGLAKAYNPYYTLIVQRLCSTSHSHKVTLQYCLWDFLRDMGEKEVGGAEVVKSATTSSDFGTKGKQVTETKLSNLARALAWCVAKDATNLLVLKPVDFTQMQPQTRTFFKTFFTQLFISSQATSPLLSSAKALPKSSASVIADPWDRKSVELVFMKATKISALAQGLLYIVPVMLKDVMKKSEEAPFFTWALEVARDALRRGGFEEEE